MGAKRVSRGDVISTLNRLVQEGVITSFRTDLFDREEVGAEPTVIVMVPDPGQPEPALRRVREGLTPLGVNLTVRLSTWQMRSGDQ